MLRETIGGVVLSLAAAAGVLGYEDAVAPAPPAEEPAGPLYLSDRGTGLPTTLFGTYIRKGEWIAYPFFEYYRDQDREYKPSELGFAGEQDFRGRYRASEGLLYLGYGVTDDVALEMEAAVIDATLYKSDQDPSALPAKLHASGLGDIDAHLLWRWRRESEGHPEVFSFVKVALPRRGADPLIGTPDWELGLGTGLTRGFGWGTVTLRAAIEVAPGSTSRLDAGEYALEYLKRLSPRWRVYAAVEGTQDEVSLITELQWHLARNAFLRINNGFGITSKATDWEPEIGLLFTVPTRRTHR